MAFKKIRKDGYIADTIEDLKFINEKSLGVECYVIKEACEYKRMSTGEWIKQITTPSNLIEGNVDLENYYSKLDLIPLSKDEILEICK